MGTSLDVKNVSMSTDMSLNSTGHAVVKLTTAQHVPPNDHLTGGGVEC